MTSDYKYKDEKGRLIFPISQIDAMYLRNAALKAGDFEAAAFFEDEAAAFLYRDLSDGL